MESKGFKGWFLLVVALSLCFDAEGHSVSHAFKMLDTSNNGVLEWGEWSAPTNKLMVAAAEFENDKGKRIIPHLRTTFDRIDMNGDNVISLDEFLTTGPTPQADTTVRQVHLARTAVDTEMVVVWVTVDNTTTSEMQVGLKSGVYSNSFFGYTTTYDVGEAGGWHKYIHVVKATGLLAGTKYYYKCGDAKAGYSPDYSFTTPPPKTPTIFALVADMGTYIPLGWAVAKQIADDNAQFNFSLVVHAGDIAYAGTGSSGELEEIWDTWSVLVEPVASLVPYMVAIGNHEEYYNATSFMHRFYMPGNENGGNGNLWYSIDHGNVHWIFFSTQDPYTPGTPQYQWLQKDLAAAQSNRGNVGWIIFVTHRPMYCSDTDELSEHEVGAPIQVALEPILVEYEVDIYFCGHMHMYERIDPVINGTVVQTGNTYTSPKAPMHLVVGTAGAFTDHDYVTPQPPWSAVRNGDYGYGKLTVYNNSALQFEFMVEESKSVGDEFWILK